MSLPVKVLVSALIAADTTIAEETIKETHPLYAGTEKCRRGDLKTSLYSEQSPQYSHMHCLCNL